LPKIDPGLVLNLDKTASPEIEEIMNPQFFTHLAESYRVYAPPPYGLIMCLLCLEGEPIVVGMKFDTLPGDTFTEKRAALMKIPGETFYASAVQGGFTCALPVNSVIGIPPGFALVVLNANKEHSNQGLMWEIQGPKHHLKKTITYLGEIIAEKPDLKTGRYGIMLDYLQTQVN